VTSEADNERADAARPDMRGVLPAGTTLRGYELKAILGQGGFGITYRALDTTLGRDVAIKEYLPTTLAMREGRTTVVPRSADHAEQFAWGRERFLDEARTLARLDQTPSIVRVHDYLEANGTAYMVMALIEGETLAKRLLREQRLTPEAVERLLFPLLDGLEEIHGAGFLHRDIKPANIMLDARGRPVLIDFGASRAAMAEHSSTLTAIFTPGYAAPEQLSSAKLGPWSDIYGLAATLYNAITGRIPPNAMDRVLQDTCEPLSVLQPPGFSPALLAGIDAGLAVRVVNRPQNIAEWRHILRTGETQSLAQGPTQIARKPSTPPRAARAARQDRITIGRPVLWGAVAAVMLLVAGGGWLAWQASAPAPAMLTVEQLERALSELRRAEALAAEKRQLEAAAREKAEAEDQAKRQADSELEQVRQARQRAEDDLAKLKAELEAGRQQLAGQREEADAALRRAAEEAAQRKAEEEAEGLRQAEEEAKKKAAAEAEAKHQADAALARAAEERSRAEQEARQKAEAQSAAVDRASPETQRKAMEAEARREAEEAEAKARAEREKAAAEASARAEADRVAAAQARQKEEAETAEKALRLEAADRERLQVALTSLGFDTRGHDGILGPRTREMIAAWQKARNQPATGFLTSAQQQALMKEAALAVARHDDRRKAEEDAKARPMIAAAPTQAGAATPSSPPTVSPGDEALTGRFDGVYSGEASAGGTGGWAARLTFTLVIKNGRGSGSLTSPGCSASQFSATVSENGLVSGQGSSNCVIGAGSGMFAAGPFAVDGRFEGRSMRLGFHSDRGMVRAVLNPGSSASAAPLPSPDGYWRGTYSCKSPAITLAAFSLDIDLLLTNGSGTWRNPRISAPGGPIFDIHVSIDQNAVTVTRTFVAGSNVGRRDRLRGHYSGNTITAATREESTQRECSLTLTRA